MLSKLIGLYLLSSFAVADVIMEQKYQNQRGSTLWLQVHSDNHITGEFITAVGCGIGIPREIAGFKKGKALGFVVSFGECDSLTSWSGHFTEDGGIQALWQLSTDGDEWNTTYAGFHIFEPIEQGE